MRSNLDPTGLAGTSRRLLPLARVFALVAWATLTLLACDGSEPSSPSVDAALPESSPTHRSAAERAPVPSEIAGLPPRYQELHTMLESEDVLMEWKHEIVLDDLAPDTSAEATTLLILATTNPSIAVSMASLMTLADRMDDRVEDHLVTLLEDTSWKRRAWSARILGQTGRHDALVPLTEILTAESDARVRRQVEQAIAALETPKPAAEAATAPQRAATGEAGG